MECLDNPDSQIQDQNSHCTLQNCCFQKVPSCASISHARTQCILKCKPQCHSFSLCCLYFLTAGLVHSASALARARISRKKQACSQATTQLPPRARTSKRISLHSRTETRNDLFPVQLTCSDRGSSITGNGGTIPPQAIDYSRILRVCHTSQAESLF